MHSCGAALQWFAIRTATGREKLVSMQLQNKGYEDFLPLYRSRRQWSDRTKQLDYPLFPGYLFCRFDFSNRLPILITPGVKLIVGFGKIPAPVTCEEIESLRRVVASGAEAKPCPYLSVGQKVQVRDGALAGIEGILLQVKNSYRIVLSVELLRRSVAVELDRASVVPVRSASLPRPELMGAAHASGAESAQYLYKSAV
jgi:transcription antitermination factor NusG